MNETDLTDKQFNIIIATNNAYRRWGFAVETNDFQSGQVIVDENGKVKIVDQDTESEAKPLTSFGAS